VAGFATSAGSAGHAGATASPKLTFDLDHSMWAAQFVGGFHETITALQL
jgi:hypothetical protein